MRDQSSGRDRIRSDQKQIYNHVNMYSKSGGCVYDGTCTTSP